MPRFVKPKREIIQQFAKRVFRKYFESFNSYENEKLTLDFCDRVQAIKERNSKIIFDAYYMPKAISAILREDNYLTTEHQAHSRATAMMMNDLANGILTEFYRFKK
jgi:hypothetical protein